MTCPMSTFEQSRQSQSSTLEETKETLNIQGKGSQNPEEDPSQKIKKPSEKSEQVDAQHAYYKATAEEKRTKSFFKDIPVESVVDHEAIEESKRFGLYDLDPCF